MDVKKKLTTYSAILLTVLFWSFSYIWTKFALTGFSVFALVLFRFMLAAIIFLIIMIFKGFPKLEKKDFIKLVIISFFFPFLYFQLETLALSYTSASEAGLIAAILPVIVLILSAIFIKEKTSIAGIVGIILSFFGLYLLITGNMTEIQFSDNFAGNILMICSMVSAAIYMVIIRTLGDKYSSLNVTGTQILLGTLLLLISSLFGFSNIQIIQISPIAILSLLCLSLLSTIVAFFCYNYALTNISAAKASIFINAVPFTTALIAWIFIGEKLNMTQIIGGIIIVIAVTITNIYGTINVDKKLVKQEVN